MPENFIWKLGDLSEEEKEVAKANGAVEDEEYWGDIGNPQPDVFTCPYCFEHVVVGQCDCKHVIFIWDGTNGEYMQISPKFLEALKQKLENHGIPYEEIEHDLPRPDEGFCYVRDDDYENVIETKNLEELFAGDVAFESYTHCGPHGHGSWGWIIGFSNNEKHLN